MAKLFDAVKPFFDILVLSNKQDKDSAESDKLCFENSIKQFLVSGRKEDAFTVYFCFSEIYKMFGEGYENTKKLLETLSDHEYHSGELLTKHRDHYSHSAYVFALGLGIYANDTTFQNTFKKFYNYDNEGYAAYKFLELWGKVSLFHDIGYPFQLAHEQIKTYNSELWGKDNKCVPYVSYGNVNSYIAIDEQAQALLQKTFNGKSFANINDILAYGLNLRMGYDQVAVSEMLIKRVVEQPNFMDHGYFSAVILAKQLFSNPNIKLDKEWLDVLTAILLHNNINKFDFKDKLSNWHAIDMSEHPLAYMLILCDELQCWDRLAYGKDSKRDPIAWEFDIDVTDRKIKAIYHFDSLTVTEKDGEIRLNKSLVKIQNGKFVDDINSFITATPALKIEALADQLEKEKRYFKYASDDSFINLCDFAVAINGLYERLDARKDEKEIKESFGKLSLEYKVDNINVAKSYAQKLELINCFYSSKDLDYPVVEDFRKSGYGTPGSDNFGFLCREEHLRWVKYKIKSGWKFGRENVDYMSKEERNRKKLHKCLVPFEELEPQDKEQDEIMIDGIIPMLRRCGDKNIRVYNFRAGRKPDLVVAGIGHRFIKNDEETIRILKEKIKEILQAYQKDYRVVLRTGFAYGADQLIAECATELDIEIKAALPMKYEEFVKSVREDAVQCGQPYTDDDEMKLRLLLAQTVVCKYFDDPKYTYLAASEYNIKNCNKVIALWDGEITPLKDPVTNEPINQGGTYHCIEMAHQFDKNDKDIHIIHCHRK